jgi:hypothetical protein
MQLRHEQKLTIREIAGRLDRAPSTIAGYLSDPAASIAAGRKRQFHGPCTECGGPTSGRASGAVAVQRCRSCAATARTRWPRALIESAVLAWLARYGSLPSSYDLSATHSHRRGGTALKRWREGFRDGLPWPSASILTSRYGSYANAIAAAVASTSPARLDATAPERSDTYERN